MLLSFIKYKDVFKKSWKPWTTAALSGWCNFLKIAIPVGSIVYLEWFSFEFYTIQAANLANDTNDNALLTAHGALANSCSLYSMLSMGISIAIATYVGNAVGSFNSEKA